ncbi:hypothetical protein FGB62_97g111 [Gracilaria domingensis]|nr:hypothetical protein FGB62_97g111 [Gracilaria domingensis]
MKPKRKRLTANSHAVKLLRMKLENWELDGTEKAEKVWRSEALFQEHKLDTFRACYNRIRKDLGLPLKDPSIHLVPRSSMDPRRDHELILVDSDPSNSDDKSYGGEHSVDANRNKWVLFEQLDWRPFYLISEWKEPETTTKRLSVGVVMRSGLQRGDFYVQIVDENKSLQIKVNWPRTMIHPKILHAKWLNQSGEKYTDHHPELIGFESALKDLRELSKDRVMSATKIVLPFAVESQLVSDNIRFSCGTIIYYVRLKAFNKSYAYGGQNTDEFELVE